MDPYALPQPIQAAIDREFHGRELNSVRRAATKLSDRYRNSPSARTRIEGDADVLAYLAVRAPATYAAVRRVAEELALRMPDLIPSSLLDVGCGPGTALWAALERWPALHTATLLDTNAHLLRAGRQLADRSLPATPHRLWRRGDLANTDDLPAADLTVASYTLGELPRQQIGHVITMLWRHTSQALVVVEPGTPHGARAVLAARKAMIDAGANVIAPCPSSDRCPKTDGPSWCHFAVRLPRRWHHRQIKQTQLNYEDEKYAYIIAAREPGPTVQARVVAPPTRASGRIELELCQAPDLVKRTVTKRHGPLYRSARHLAWGSALTPE